MDGDTPLETAGAAIAGRLEALYRERNEALVAETAALERQARALEATLAESAARLAELDGVETQLAQEIESLGGQRDELIEAVNRLRRLRRVVDADSRSGEALARLLAAELADLESERAIVVEELEGLKQGLRRIEDDKRRIEPYGEKQDDMLRQACQLLKQARNRFEVSIVLAE